MSAIKSNKLSESLQIIVKAPHELTELELKEFETFLLEGDEVNAIGLLDRIKRAEKLIFVRDKELLGIAGVKRPYLQYKLKVFKLSKVSKLANDYAFEAGWIYTSNSHRGKGLGRLLMQSVQDIVKSTGCFATTRENNEAMHHLFTQYGFSKVGESYKSENREDSLVLYLLRPQQQYCITVSRIVDGSLKNRITQ